MELWSHDVGKDITSCLCSKMASGVRYNHPPLSSSCHPLTRFMTFDLFPVDVVLLSADTVLSASGLHPRVVFLLLVRSFILKLYLETGSP